MKRLIVNADDFGLHAVVNAGIREAHSRGIVTSTSLMATTTTWPCPWSQRVVANGEIVSESISVPPAS